MTKDELVDKLELENRDLKKQLESLVNENHLKDEIVIQQSKMASMGEMINNIAHQWRQPLMEISSLLMNTEAKIKLEGDISKDDIIDTIDKSNHVIQFMSHTIDDFRNFFASNKERETFLIAEQLSSMLNIMKISLSHSNIKVDIIIKNNLKVCGFKNEYAQVLVNIISNAKDAIIQNKIKNGKITIKLYEKDTRSVLEIEDNAGGIPFEPKQKVFEPFFTFKKKNGTGIGLFMSKLIIENNMNGKLDVKNTSKGACFSIKL